MLSTMPDGDLSLVTLLENAANQHADSEVMTWTGAGVRTETFAELGTNSAKLASALRSLGVTGDQRVGTFMMNNAEHLTAYTAVPAMGAVLHTLNVRLFPEQLIYTANQAEDHTVIVDGSLAPVLAERLPRMKSVQHVIVTGGDASVLDAPSGVEVHSYDELLAAQPDTFAWERVDERSAAALCYTSGTTGKPKGVTYSHRSMWLHSMQICMSDCMGLAQSDTALAIVPMFHVMSLGVPYAALMVGASLVLPDRFIDPEPLTEILATTRPTIAAVLPFMWQGVIQQLEKKPQDVSHLREVMIGGSAAPPSMIHESEEKFGVAAVHAWGMTESSPMATIARAPKSAAEAERWEYRYTQGRFPASVQARLMDSEGNPLPWDGTSVGEVELRGPWITTAYFAVEKPEPDQFRDGWLRTGDVGTITEDGFFTLTDRIKDVIKTGGELISSIELENKIMGHPAVLEAAVIGIVDERYDERPLAVVVLHRGQMAKPEELRGFLSGKIADWQIPDYWAYIDEIPRTSVGKFDKKQLRALYAIGEFDDVFGY